MYPPQSLDHLKQQIENTNAVSRMDTWEKIEHYGTQVSTCAGAILFGILNPFNANSEWVAIGIFISATMSGVISIILLTFLHHLWDKIYN